MHLLHTVMYAHNDGFLVVYPHAHITLHGLLLRVKVNTIVVDDVIEMFRHEFVCHHRFIL